MFKGDVGHRTVRANATLFLNSAFSLLQTRMNMGQIGLSKDWATMPAFDLELKRYQLLAYLQRVQDHFGQHKLHPFLPDLRAHHANLVALRRIKDEMRWALQGALVGFDPDTGDPIHERLEDEVPLRVIDDVLELAIPRMERAVAKGDRLWQELSKRIQFEPIGLQPLDLRTGWLMLGTQGTVRVYAYSIPWIQGSTTWDGQHAVRTNYVSTFTLGLMRSYEHIRSELLRGHRNLPLAATFALECAVPLPCMETFIPLAKQRVYDLFTAVYPASA